MMAECLHLYFCLKAGFEFKGQPCDTGHAEQNARLLHECIDYIKTHPQWRLSLQTHKLIDIK